MNSAKLISIAIIGAGPAGMAAALQLTRYGHKPILFEQDLQGSLLLNAWKVENYLGIFPGMSGKELLINFRIQIEENDISITKEKVLELDYNEEENLFMITTANSKYIAKYTIIASGTMPKTLPAFENAPPALKQYLHYSVAPLLDYSNREIVIIGAGDAAFDYALNLALRDNKVHLINHGHRIKALPLLSEKAFVNPNISYYENTLVKEIVPSSIKNVNCVFVNSAIECDFALAAIGRAPQKTFYSQKFARIESKLIKNGVLCLAGDVKNDIYRQTAIAVSDGIYAAMRIVR